MNTNINNIAAVSAQEFANNDSAFNFYETVMHNDDLGFDDLPEIIRQFALAAHDGRFIGVSAERGLMIAFLNTIYASSDHKTVFVAPFSYTLQERKNMVEAFSAIVKFHGGTVHHWPTECND